MVVLDTNILVYAIDQRSPGHGPCHELIESLRRQSEPWYLTWGIIYEFIRVTTHRNVLNKPMASSDAWHYVAELLASPGVRVLAETSDHLKTAREVFGAVPEVLGSLVFDARTAILMREHGVTRIITRDTDFFRFPFLEVIDPLQPLPSLVNEGRGAYTARKRRRAPAAARA